MRAGNISEQEIYGYELVQRLKDAGFTTIVGGTVYPLPQKLEKQKLIKGTMKKSAEGPIANTLPSQRMAKGTWTVFSHNGKI